MTKPTFYLESVDFDDNDLRVITFRTGDFHEPQEGWPLPGTDAVEGTDGAFIEYAQANNGNAPESDDYECCAIINVNVANVEELDVALTWLYDSADNLGISTAACNQIDARISFNTLKSWGLAC